MQHPSLAKENKLYEHTSTMKPQDLANRSKGRPGGGVSWEHENLTVFLLFCDQTGNRRSTVSASVRGARGRTQMNAQHTHARTQLFLVGN